MKSLRRFFLPLLCLVLLLGVFSITANAAEIDVGELQFYGSSTYTNRSGTKVTKTRTWISGDGTVDQVVFDEMVSGGSAYDIMVDTETYIKKSNGKAILLAGQIATITIEDVYQQIAVYRMTNEKWKYVPDQVSGFAIFTDGTVKYLQMEIINKRDTAFDLKFILNADKDVAQICYHTKFIIADGYNTLVTNPSNSIGVLFRFGEKADETDHNVRIDVQDPMVNQQQQTNDKLDEANNKLEQMLDSLFNGFNDLGDKTEKGFAGLGEKIKEVFNAITNLPAKIWEFIENGLKNLFVPDEEFMVSYKDKWSNLLADKLGAVYQVTEIIFGAWDDVRNADQTNSINLPVVTIPLPQNNSFSFGGYDVKIVPDGFESAVELVKVAIGIVCTFMFINGVRRRYDEIMGVNE